jgi:hypothetical protein
VHRFQMTVDVPHTVASGRIEPIAMVRDRLVPEVIAAVRARGFESGWYGNFVEDERILDRDGEVVPDTAVGLGWTTYPHHPRFGSNYRGLTNRLDLLLECYSYLPFEERVQTASAWQIETLRWAATHAGAIRETVIDSARPPAKVAVRYRLDVAEAPVEVLTRAPRTLEGEPVALRLPHLARFVGTTVVERPRGYLVPPAVAEHLARHGLRVAPAHGGYDVAVARVESLGTEEGRAILEAAKVGELGVSWREEAIRAAEGWSVVETDQPLGAIAVYLCEPESDDGAVENGLVPAPRVGEDFPIWRVA